MSLRRARHAALWIALLACGSPDTQRPAAQDSAAATAAAGAAAAAATVSRSADAKADLVELLRGERFGHHPSDGGGRAWLRGFEAGGRPQLTAGSRVRLPIVYEAGPLGIAEGGALILRVSRYWDWDDPQLDSPDARGYTAVRTDAPGVSLALARQGRRRLAVGIRGRNLAAGERIEIVYGAGPPRARADRYAERGERLWLYVDGDGDGAPGVVEESPELDLLPDVPARLVLHLTASAHPGEAVWLTAALLDRAANAGAPFTGVLELDAPPGLALPERAVFEERHAGRLRLAGAAGAEGVFRVRARAVPDGGATVLEAQSNPLVVSADAPRVLWGDLHGHSQLSDGTGAPEDYFAFARDVAGLDVSALTDHDHWGMRYLDERPGDWARIRSAVRDFHEPGHFVTILGYEWTNWVQGHRHVLYFADDGPVLSAIDPRYETPDLLWRALAGRSALTFAHHSAGWPVSTNWDFVPDPSIEPVTEIASLHGSSEASETPARIEHPVRGNFVRDVLDRGLQLGFIGSGDGHDGHPGLTRLEARSGGLAGILCESLTRACVREALLARRVYATNGARIVLHATLDGYAVGAEVPTGSEARLAFRAVADGAPFERVDVIRAGAVSRSLPGEGRSEWAWSGSLPGLAPGEYLYLRFVQTDGAAAWTSPFFASGSGDVR